MYEHIRKACGVFSKIGHAFSRLPSPPALGGVEAARRVEKAGHIK
jgi:hypothetical protein